MSEDSINRKERRIHGGGKERGTCGDSFLCSSSFSNKNLMEIHIHRGMIKYDKTNTVNGAGTYGTCLLIHYGRAQVLSE